MLFSLSLVQIHVRLPGHGSLYLIQPSLRQNATSSRDESQDHQYPVPTLVSSILQGSSCRKRCHIVTSCVDDVFSAHRGVHLGNAPTSSFSSFIYSFLIYKNYKHTSKYHTGSDQNLQFSQHSTAHLYPSCLNYL